MARTKGRLSNEERLKRKRECEKRRCENIRKNAEKLKALKDKKHEIYLKAKESGRVKLVNDMDSREKRMYRRKWRTEKRNYRHKKKCEEKINSFVRENTPETSDSDEEISEPTYMPLTPTVAETVNTSQGINKSESSQKKRGRKLVRRDRAKAYHDINKLKAENEKLRKKCSKYKKRWQRARSGVSSQQDLTPKTTVKKIAERKKYRKGHKKKGSFW